MLLSGVAMVYWYESGASPFVKRLVRVRFPLATPEGGMGLTGYRLAVMVLDLDSRITLVRIQLP